MPLSTLESARDTLGRLRSSTAFTTDDLFTVSSDCDAKLQDLVEHELSVIDLLRPRPFLDNALDLSAWLLGIAGYLVSVTDYYAEGGLSLWGWMGLVIGWIGLVLAATVYTQRTWVLEDCAAELSEISQWKDVLTEIMDEVDRRLMFV